MNIATAYGIGDKIHACCYSDYSFELEIEIEAITNFAIANATEDVLKKYFNSETNYAASDYESALFYICKVLTATTEYKVGDKIVLCDKLIDTTKTYYLSYTFSVIADIVLAPATCTYKRPADMLAAITALITDSGATSQPYIGKTEEEQAKEELDALRNITANLLQMATMKESINALVALDATALKDATTNLLTAAAAIDKLVNK